MAPFMTRTVLLRHTLPDGSWHYDWMVERPVRDEHRLVTFRTRERVDRADEIEFDAERISDHRAAYLDFEGELSGGRGRVERVAAGNARDLFDGDEFRVLVDFGDGWRRVTASVVPGGRDCDSVEPRRNRLRVTARAID